MKCAKKPCKNCPFRKAEHTKGWLGAKRMQSICDQTIMGDDYFVCHKTVNLPATKQHFCVGKLLVEKKVNPYANSSTRVGIATGIIPKHYALQGDKDVFDTVAEAVAWHDDSR